MAESGSRSADAGRKPWEHRSGESFKWFHLFTQFRLLGPGRELIRVYQDKQRRLGKTPAGSLPGYWKHIVRDWQWWERATAWDAEREQVVTPALESIANQDQVDSLCELLDAPIDPDSGAGQLQVLEKRIAALETEQRQIVDRLTEMELQRGDRLPGLG